jgi:hypothetical protein
MGARLFRLRVTIRIAQTGDDIQTGCAASLESIENWR